MADSLIYYILQETDDDNRAMTFFTLIAYLASSNLQFAALNSVRVISMLFPAHLSHSRRPQTSPVIGLAFSFVIVRAALGLGAHQPSTMSTMSFAENVTGRRSQRSQHVPISIKQHTETIQMVDDVPSMGKKVEYTLDCDAMDVP